MKKIITSIAIIAAAAAVVMSGTTAFFSDTETSAGNTFSTGGIDLTVDSQCTYNGATSSQCGTWALKNLMPTADKFFNFTDLKPGDEGENTISFHVNSNDAYMCAVIGNMQNDDNGLTEPEEEDGDATNGLGNGELAQELHFFAWEDDGDNLWEEGEEALFSNVEGPASDILDGKVYPLYTPETGSLSGSSTNYLGVYWCYGELTVDLGTNALACDGSGATNVTQTDSLTADISFYVEQARNNEEFSCADVAILGVQVGASFANYSVSETCDINVPADQATIQAAITAAVDGDVICVATGTYPEFIVDKAVTVIGLNSPDSLGAAVVAPSAPTVTELALVTADNVIISGLRFDGTGTVFTGNQLSGIQVTPTGLNTDVSNVVIKNNYIAHLSTSAATASSKGIQLHTPGAVNSFSGISIKNNLITDVKAISKGAYGLQTVGALNGLTATDNTISDIDGAWEAGAAFDALVPVTTTNVQFARNQVLSAIPTFSVQVEANVDGAGIMINQNNLETLLYGGSSGTPSPAVLDAELNWWGTPAPALGTDVFVAPGTNVVDFTPAQAAAYALN